MEVSHLERETASADVGCCPKQHHTPQLHEIPARIRLHQTGMKPRRLVTHAETERGGWQDAPSQALLCLAFSLLHSPCFLMTEKPRSDSEISCYVIEDFSSEMK